MNVYSYFSPDGPELDLQLVPLWEESWRRQGWTPRLLTIRDARKHPDFANLSFAAFLAWAQVGGGWYSKINTINFSFLPRQPKSRIESVGDGVLWASKNGVKEFVSNHPYNCNCPNKIKIKRLVNVFGFDYDTNEVLPLVSFSRCENIEEVQHGIESCLQARKKI